MHTLSEIVYVLSVNFEPVPQQSRTSGKERVHISREDLDAAIANGIKLALKEQQSTLDSVVASTVREAIDSVLTPALRDLRLDIQTTNDSVKELKAEVEKLAIATKQTRDRVDSIQTAAREDRRRVTNLRNQLEQLTGKMTDIEDRSIEDSSPIWRQLNYGTKVSR